MHEDTDKEEVPNPEVVNWVVGGTVHMCPKHYDNKTRQIGFNPDYNMKLFISVLNLGTLSVSMLLESGATSHALVPLLRHMEPLSDGNCLFKMSVVKVPFSHVRHFWMTVTKLW